MRANAGAVSAPTIAPPARTYLELLDWRRRVSELFAELRRRPPDAGTLAWFRAEKDQLFRSHPQTPVLPERRATFSGLSYWPYDPDARVVATLTSDPTNEQQPPATENEVAFNRIGTLHFTLAGQSLTLGAYWIAGYAGGLFVPFRDATSGSETYGGGRYLLDTIKSADLGSDLAAGTVVLDFNYAYHPSCAYDPQWPCPLAPPANRVSTPIRCGERL
jgi:uncharacterized protein